MLDEETMVAYGEWDRALDSIIDYIADADLLVRWKAKGGGKCRIRMRRGKLDECT